MSLLRTRSADRRPDPEAADGAARGTRLALLFASHDLTLLARTVDSIAVMQHGQIVEQGSTPDLFNRPQHPYTDLSSPRMNSCRTQKHGEPANEVRHRRLGRSVFLILGRCFYHLFSLRWRPAITLTR